MGHPCQTVSQVEETEGELPGHGEWVDEEEVPGEGYEAIIHAVGVLEVDDGVLDVVAREEQQFSLSVELHCFGWNVHLVCQFEVFVGTLSNFSLCRVHNLVQVVNLSKSTEWGVVHQ